MPDKTVYSTDPSWKAACPKCGRTPCACTVEAADEPRQAEPLRLSFARGAKGSGVTRIERLAANPRHKLDLLRRFKQRLGCGGAVKGGALEIQGDRREWIEKELITMGYKVKRVGGVKG